MARAPGKQPKKNEEPRKRRIKAAQDIEYLIPGGRKMSDDQLEIALDWLMRPG